MQNDYTRLIVRDLRIDALLGVYAHEKTATQPVLINIEADVTLPDAWQADNYEAVLGYDKIVEMVRAVASAGHIHLVETLAETLAARCLEWQQVRAVKVRVEKPTIFPDCVPGVEIYRVRA